MTTVLITKIDAVREAIRNLGQQVSPLDIYTWINKNYPQLNIPLGTASSYFYQERHKVKVYTTNSIPTTQPKPSIGTIKVELDAIRQIVVEEML